MNYNREQNNNIDVLSTPVLFLTNVDLTCTVIGIEF